MANYEHKNVIVGAARVYISVSDSTEAGWTGEGVAVPALSTSAATALDGSADWRLTGYTTDGVEVSYEPDYGEVVVDQALDSVKMFKQGMRVSVNTTFAEATLENLMVAWGQDSDTLTADTNLQIAAGDLGDEPVERSLAFIGQAPRGSANEKRERVYHLRRALQVETSAHSLSRTDATTIPVSFRCLPVPTASSGQEYGSIIQRVVS